MNIGFSAYSPHMGHRPVVREQLSHLGEAVKKESKILKTNYQSAVVANSSLIYGAQKLYAKGGSASNPIIGATVKAAAHAAKEVIDIIV